MTAPENQRGAALLTVLLLVAVMATIAATALDRIGVGTKLAVNAAALGQGRAWLSMAELLAATRLQDRIAADTEKTTGTGWLGVSKSIALPDGAVVEARLEDGGNCFNLNSLVRRQPDGAFVPQASAAKQFSTLVALLGVTPGEATGIVAATTDYLDSDSLPLPAGSEGSSDSRYLPANRPMVSASELRAIPGVSERAFQLLEKWVCALPTTDLSPINVNTLLPDQSPLIAMLLPGQSDLSKAKAAIAGRPSEGYSNAASFWNEPALAALDPDADAKQQLQVKTRFFVLHARVRTGGVSFAETALLDARPKVVRIVSRSWGDAS